MTKQEPWFIAERSRWFASLVLTKCNDVKIRPDVGDDKAINLLVEILKGGKPTLRFFAVQIIPHVDLPSIKDADEQVLAHLGRNSLEAALPLCVFVIGVRKPEGIFRWVVQPVVEDGRALLHRDREAAWQTLDEAGATHLIGQVNAWYDALHGASTRQPRGRPAKMESC
jgi:hypothetical protein